MDFELPKNPKVSALQGSPAKGIALTSVILLAISLFFSGVLKIIFIVLGVIILLLALSNVYIRLQSNWAKIHYPVSLMYTKAVGFVTGKYPDMPLEERVKQAMYLVMTTLYPSMSDEDADTAIKNIDNNNVLTNRGVINKLFKYKGVEEKELNELTEAIIKRYRLDQPETVNKLRVANLYAHIIGAKYGEKEVYEYILAMINNKVK